MFNKTNFLLGFLMLFSAITMVCMTAVGQIYFGISDPKFIPICFLSLILAYMFEKSSREESKKIKFI